MPQLLTISDTAASRVQEMLAKRGKPSVGIKIGIRTRGCSGLSYTIEYADEISKFDTIVEEKGVRLLIDPKAEMVIARFASHPVATNRVINPTTLPAYDAVAALLQRR